jgi:hypothetical protein
VFFYFFRQARRVGGQARRAIQEISLLASTQPTVSELHTVMQCLPTVLDKLDVLEDKLDMQLGVFIVKQYSTYNIGISYCDVVYFYLFGQARRVGGQARRAIQEISFFASTQPTV